MKCIQNMSIKKKIGFLFSGCFLVFLVGTILILHHVYRKQLYQEMIQRGHYEDELIVNQMGMLAQNVESCCNNIIINLNISIGEERKGLMGGLSGFDTKTRGKILRIMGNNFLIFKDVSEIRILSNSGELYIKERDYDIHYIPECMELKEFKKTKVDTRGMWYHLGTEKAAVYFLKVLNDVQDNTQVGYILLELEEEVIYDSYQNRNMDNLSQIYVFDDQGYLLSSSQRNLIEELYQIDGRQKQSHQSWEIYQELLKKKEDPASYYIRELSTPQGWTVVSVLDMKAGMEGLHNITRNIILAGIILALLFFSGITGILRKILDPMVALASHMRESGNDLIRKIEEPKGQDEVGILISSFNQMVDKNDKLIQNAMQNEQERRKLELALLQMQIKPHFLYNTLDTAFCLNSMRMYQEANRVIKQLAGYYRLTLNHGDEWIRFSEEVEVVEKYLDIQSMRYQELISYRISVDEELDGFLIPKMTLQPLVENAIYHGIKPSGRKGHILIQGEYYQDEVTISVTDDGIGMSRSVFEEVLSGKKGGADKESFGMKSVSERLRLYYKERGNMELSPTAIGTSIVLSIDMRKSEEN